MNRQARRALATIQDCVASGRYRVLAHFVRRMDQRCLFWPDVQAVVDSPHDVKDDGLDDYDRPKWILRGRATSGLELEIVCALDVDDRGAATVFITAY